VTKPKPKPAPEDETPFQWFERVLKKVISVSKAALDEREREWKQRREASS
jgi:hypothetical protein